MRARGVYLDHAATTPPHPAVVQEMRRVCLSAAGNPSSIHGAGLAAARVVEGARSVLARAIGARPEEILFTSGGTEANNLALKGAALGQGPAGHLIVSGIEHPSVLGPARRLAAMGYRLTVLPVDGTGRVSPDDVRRAIRKDTFLVSVMQVNNELGTIEPVEPISRLCRERGLLFHTDACQGFTKLPLAAGPGGPDLATLNSHKIGGPHGVGCLYVRAGVRLAPLLDGGPQENGLRPGTHNLEAIAGFAKAVEVSSLEDAARMAGLRDDFIAGVASGCPGLRINGPGPGSLASIVSLSFPGLSGKALLARLDREGVFVSTGSACSARRLAPSHVLTAIGLSRAEALSALRVSIGRRTTRRELGLAAEALCSAARAERRSGHGG